MLGATRPPKRNRRDDPPSPSSLSPKRPKDSLNCLDSHQKLEANGLSIEDSSPPKELKQGSISPIQSDVRRISDTRRSLPGREVASSRRDDDRSAVSSEKKRQSVPGGRKRGFSPPREGELLAEIETSRPAGPSSDSESSLRVKDGRSSRVQGGRPTTGRDSGLRPIHREDSSPCRRESDQLAPRRFLQQRRRTTRRDRTRHFDEFSDDTSNSPSGRRSSIKEDAVRHQRDRSYQSYKGYKTGAPDIDNDSLYPRFSIPKSGDKLPNDLYRAPYRDDGRPRYQNDAPHTSRSRRRYSFEEERGDVELYRNRSRDFEKSPRRDRSPARQLSREMSSIKQSRRYPITPPKLRNRSKSDSPSDSENLSPSETPRGQKDEKPALVENASSVPAEIRDPGLSRTGGIYIPPFKLAMMRREAAEKNSAEYQRQHWDALKKTITGWVNKANITNIPNLIEEMFRVNLIRGRGLLARAILKAQMASPSLTNIFAALLAVVNSKLPEVGRLLVVRLFLQFRRAYKRNNKVVILACLRFVAHLVNQRILSDMTALEICALLLETPTNDGVEVCCSFLCECGQALQDWQSTAFNMIFERLRSILNEGQVDTRTQYTIERLFEVRRKKFSEFPALLPGVDLIEEDDQVTHSVDILDDSLELQELLDVFKPVEPSQFSAEEAKWKTIANDILSESEDHGAESDSSVDSEVACNEAAMNNVVKDYTEQDLINLRKTVYLCIMSSASFEECVHKLLKLNIPEGQEIEVCKMLIDCCSMERAFSRFFAQQAERLSQLRESYREAFLVCFHKQYEHVHRLDTNKLRNVAKFFAHMFASGKK